MVELVGARWFGMLLLRLACRDGLVGLTYGEVGCACVIPGLAGVSSFTKTAPGVARGGVSVEVAAFANSEVVFILHELKLCLLSTCMRTLHV